MLTAYKSESYALAYTANENIIFSQILKSCHGGYI